MQELGMIEGPQAWLSFSTKLNELSSLKSGFLDLSIVYHPCSETKTADSLVKTITAFYMNLYFIGYFIFAIIVFFSF